MNISSAIKLRLLTIFECLNQGQKTSLTVDPFKNFLTFINLATVQPNTLYKTGVFENGQGILFNIIKHVRQITSEVLFLSNIPRTYIQKESRDL